jgi:hypothetical protein
MSKISASVVYCVVLFAGGKIETETVPTRLRRAWSDHVGTFSLTTIMYCSCIRSPPSGISNIRSALLHQCEREKSRVREGWPLLTVETEVNGESKSTNERGPSLVGSLGSPCWYMRLLSCLGCSGHPSTKYLFPRHSIFQFMCPHRPETWAGIVQGCLSVKGCLREDMSNYTYVLTYRLFICRGT